MSCGLGLSIRIAAPLMSCFPAVSPLGVELAQFAPHNLAGDLGPEPSERIDKALVDRPVVAFSCMMTVDGRASSARSTNGVSRPPEGWHKRGLG
jgi:hypothetical protein